MRFNHETTGFDLRGQHTTVTCRHCHSNLIFSHIGVSCADCHEDVHQAELGVQCQDCHTPASWNNVQEIFETHSVTRFPLVGVHAIVDCESCHSKNDPYEYRTTPLTCEQCHRQVYLSSANPNHIQAQFSTDCEVCHSLAAPSWNQTSYLHPQSFQIIGAHINVDCNGCHQSVFTGTPNRCEDCHMKDYTASQDPDHAKFGFPIVCETCHNQNRWEDAIFDHLEASGFEIRGAHLTIQCISCHVNNQINGLPRECIGCHEADYTGVEDPSHVSGQFPNDCLQCHSEMVWSPATFNHNDTNFPLTGAHVSLDCSNCHATGYSGTPVDCIACHRTEYDNTTDPNHQAAEFPVQCETCHNTLNWDQTTWDHDGQYFPIYSGKHREAWDTCMDCHVSAADYKVFECIFCHEHDDPQDLAEKHKNEEDYLYQSSACYTCHPNGTSEDD
jgi:hypothetical protein